MKVLSMMSGALILGLGACDGFAPECYREVIDACRKAADIAAFVGAEAATSMSAGNAIIGESGALHQPARLSISVQSTAMNRSAPRIGNPPLRADSVAGNNLFDIKQGTSASYTINVAFGVLPGISAGNTRVGGLDMLGSASLVPSFSSDDLHLRTERQFGTGIGARVGLIEETAALPALSVSAMVRTAPRFSAETPILPMPDGSGVRLALSKIDASMTTVHLAASKRFGRIGLTGGVGRDSYDLAAESRVVSPDNATILALQHTSIRWSRGNAFGGVSLALGKATAGAEVGRVFAGGAPDLVNSFGDQPITRPRTYFTLGLKVAAGRAYERKRSGGR